MRDLCLENFTTKLAPLIFRENHKQCEKWGVQDLHPFAWLAFITEEVGELSEAISEHLYREGLAEEVVNEAIQVATLSLKVAEMYQNTLVTPIPEKLEPTTR